VVCAHDGTRENVLAVACSMAPDGAPAVARLCIWGVLHLPMTWDETLAFPRALDDVFRVDDAARQHLRAALAQGGGVLHHVYAHEVGDPDNPVRMLLKRSNDAAYTAFRDRDFLVREWLAAPFSPATEQYVSRVRAFLLARMLDWCLTATPEFAAYYQIAALGRSAQWSTFSIAPDEPPTQAEPPAPGEHPPDGRAQMSATISA
jgi:hypothetical protein